MRDVAARSKASWPPKMVALSPSKRKTENNHEFFFVADVGFL
jgi:hypothetical protein